jgi:hypothetical protein
VVQLQQEGLLIREMSLMNCTTNEDYDRIEYWNGRYEVEVEGDFEWCKDYSVIKPLLMKYVKKTDSILMLGELKQISYIMFLRKYAFYFLSLFFVFIHSLVWPFVLLLVNVVPARKPLMLEKLCVAYCSFERKGF